HGQAGVAGDHGAAEDVDVGEEVGVPLDVRPAAAGEPVPAQVEAVHRPPVGNDGVNDVAVAARVLAQPVAEQQHTARRRGQPALPVQLDVTRADDPALGAF